MIHLRETWPHLLYLLGMVFEFIGVFFMASRYTNVYLTQIPTVMISSLWRGDAARDASDISDLTKEKALSILQGLSFLVVGFILRTAPAIVALIG
jgi:hypothetical protein